MTRRMNHVVLLAAVLLVYVFSSCEENKIPVVGGEGDVLVQFILEAPGSGQEATPQPTSVTGDEEVRIDEVDVLAFEKSGNDLLYSYTATVISVSPTTGANRVITARVKATGEEQGFIVLANSSAELAAAQPVKGEKINDIEKRIICRTGGGEWPAGEEGNSFVPFPMCIRIEKVVIDDNTQTIGPYPMLRMVARVDVTLKADITNFVLEEACLYNYKKAGYVSYFNSGFNVDRVTVPAVPPEGEHSGDPVLKPTVVSKASNGAIERAIYTFESEGIANQAEANKKVALIIGGRYEGSQNITYYRIDLKDKNETGTTNISSNILRNYLYSVEVQSVTKAGYLTPDDAYLGVGYIAAEVTAWNLAEQDTNYDGQYYLKVSRDRDEPFYRWIPEDNVLTVSVETDYATSDRGFRKGIYTDKIVYSPVPANSDGWITIVNKEGADGSESRKIGLVINRERVPINTYEAFARVPLRAGNVTKILTVTYRNEYYPPMHTGWAGCNIYYSSASGHLTFDGVGVKTNEKKQGVFFTGGSLWGISPMMTSTTDVAWKNSVVMFKPDGGTTTAGEAGYADYSVIPRVRGDLPTGHPPAGEFEGSRAYIYEFIDYSTGAGDICKYLTIKGWAPAGKWRMPTKRELGGIPEYSGQHSTGNNEIKENGDGDFSLGRSRRDDNIETFFPASGFRVAGGEINSVGTYGGYWSSSAKSTSAACLYFAYSGDINVWPVEGYRYHALTMRCVRE